MQAAILAWKSFRIAERSPSFAALILWAPATLQSAFELAAGRPETALSAYALTPDSLSIYSLALMFFLRQSAWLYTPALLWLSYSSLAYFALESAMFWYPATALTVTALLILRGRYTSNPAD